MADDHDDRIERLLGYTSALTDILVTHLKVIVAEFEDAEGAGKEAALRLSLARRELQPWQWTDQVLQKGIAAERSAAFIRAYGQIAATVHEVLDKHAPIPDPGSASSGAERET